MLYKAAGAFVSRSIYGGFGLLAFEAQQPSMRVITSRGTTVVEFSGEHDLSVILGTRNH